MFQNFRVSGWRIQGVGSIRVPSARRAVSQPVVSDNRLRALRGRPVSQPAVSDAWLRLPLESGPHGRPSRVAGLGFRVAGSGCRVYCFGCRVYPSRLELILQLAHAHRLRLVSFCLGFIVEFV